MNRTDRLMAIVWLLRSRQKMSAAALAEAFGVGERTIYRDVQALSEAGVPVAALPGPGGGYALAAGYKLSPIAFGTEEVEALWLAGRLAAGLGLAETDDALRSAMEKILAVAAPERAAYVEKLEGLLDVQLDRRGPAVVRGDVFATLREAALGGKTVHITYGAYGAENTSERDVTPERLSFLRGAWYVEGADSASGETRTFRMDRIQACELTDRPAVSAVPRAAETPHRVVLRMPEWTARWYADHPVYRHWNPREEPPGHLTLETPPSGLNSLVATILAGAGHEVVVEPDWLVERITRDAKGAFEAHARCTEPGGESGNLNESS
jgi:predicted DNA-binding transcriptional regulator YafY